MTQITLAVPARNEAAQIAAHLAALDRAAAGTDADVAVLVLANGCEDATAEQARRFPAAHVEVRVLEATLPSHLSNAGAARRLAARAALEIFAETRILVTSDADSELDPGSLSAFADAIAAGADLVCGTIGCDLPRRLRDAPGLRRHRRIARPYASLMRELRYGADLLHGRQPPGEMPHYTASGACMALTRDLHDRLGGLPGVACGEDRALVQAAERAGACVRYSRAAHARVSSRLVGRAAGGMADTLRRRLDDPDPECDAAFLSARAARRAWADAMEARGWMGLPEAAKPLRLSALERNLPQLEALLRDRVRPDVAAVSAPPPLVA